VQINGFCWYKSLQSKPHDECFAPKSAVSQESFVSTSPNYQVRFVRSIAEVDPLQWNSLVGPAYPFLQHEFLLALETSGCTTLKTGWQVLHALVERTAEASTNTEHAELFACMPLYAKTNSMGEYVFDWSWADAYQRHGLSYYPKLVSAVPFTPCAGPRICTAASADAEQIHAVLFAAVKKLAQKMQASSWHILFPESELKQSLATLGLLQRTGCQYQWFNEGYTDFEQFLATFSSRKRKNLRKERTRVTEQGIEFVVLEGAEITDEHWRDFYRFYESTYLVRGRTPYLNRKFFTELGRTMPQYLMLVMARKEGRNIAGALFFKGVDTLYGRYWGCTEEYQFLHFETCYYQGIDYCIQHNISRIDSGAQGEHKIQRGFKPVHTWSSHWIQHSGFADAIENFLQDEQQHIDAYVMHASDYLPFRKNLELGAK
jgi:uncharacterized protein